jgi:hypothetical protein
MERRSQPPALNALDGVRGVRIRNDVSMNGASDCAHHVRLVIAAHVVLFLCCASVEEASNVPSRHRPRSAWKIAGMRAVVVFGSRRVRRRGLTTSDDVNRSRPAPERRTLGQRCHTLGRNGPTLPQGGRIALAALPLRGNFLRDGDQEAARSLAGSAVAKCARSRPCFLTILPRRLRSLPDNRAARLMLPLVRARRTAR